MCVSWGEINCKSLNYLDDIRFSPILLLFSDSRLNLELWKQALILGFCEKWTESTFCVVQWLDVQCRVNLVNGHQSRLWLLSEWQQISNKAIKIEPWIWKGQYGSVHEPYSRMLHHIGQLCCLFAGWISEDQFIQQQCTTYTSSRNLFLYSVTNFKIKIWKSIWNWWLNVKIPLVWRPVSIGALNFVYACSPCIVNGNNFFACGRTPTLKKSLFPERQSP